MAAVVIPLHPPTVVLVYMEGCDACAAAKPLFADARDRHPDVKFAVARADGAGARYEFAHVPGYVATVQGREVARSGPFRSARAFDTWVRKHLGGAASQSAAAR